MSGDLKQDLNCGGGEGNSPSLFALVTSVKPKWGGQNLPCRQSSRKASRIIRCRQAAGGERSTWWQCPATHAALSFSLASGRLSGCRSRFLRAHTRACQGTAHRDHLAPLECWYHRQVLLAACLACCLVLVAPSVLRFPAEAGLARFRGSSRAEAEEGLRLVGSCPVEVAFQSVVVVAAAKERDMSAVRRRMRLALAIL